MKAVTHIQRSLAAFFAAMALCCSLTYSAPRKGKPGLDLKEILSHMDEGARHIRTVSSDIEYTKVTVLVDDHSTETGHLFYRKGKQPEILLKFEKPDAKVILLKKNKAEMFLPKTNQIQEYDLEKHSDLIQQFLLLGFGTDSKDLQKAYDVKLTGEEQLGADTAALLELTPLSERVTSQLTKVQLWISEESWLPLKQKFLEPSGDYLETRYSSIKVNRNISSSTFQIDAPKDAKRIKMQ